MIRILVVDDDPKLNQAACTYLNDSGYDGQGLPQRGGGL